MKNKLIIALDVNTYGRAVKLIDKLSEHVGMFKVGSELFTACGPKIIRYLKKKKKKVFLDLKFHDIPNTVGGAVLAASGLGADMLTIHASGGAAMLESAARAARGAKRKPLLVAVTALTSLRASKREVLSLAKLAKVSGIDGCVSSPKETKMIKKSCGRKFVVINPGVRPAWAAQDDQKRIATPLDAVRDGADYIVVGRPVTRAQDPASAALKILGEISVKAVKRKVK